MIDPCDPPTSITGPPLEDQLYILGDTNAPSYTHPDYNIEPSYCNIVYSYDITKLENAVPDSAITRVDKTFDFEYLTDRAPLGQFQDVTVTFSSSTIYD